MDFLSFLFRFLEILCQVLTLCIVLRVIMSWISPGRSDIFSRVLIQITEPILSPLRRIIPGFGAIDLAPLVAVVILQLIATFLP